MVRIRRRKLYSSDVAISYSSEISYEKSHVHKMVSEVLHMLKLDQSHYGTNEWNPLGEFIKPGDKVVVKPNLVMHENPSGEGVECLYTQSTVVGAIIDFVIIALRETGSIIVGDAPMQGCHFDELVEKSGYKQMVEEYKRVGINIALMDFRNIISDSVKGVIIEKETVQNESVIVDLGKQSSFAELSESHLQNMRVTNYDPRILQKHHTLGKHEYSVAKEILEADVIINVPKPKTHRKAGMTGALKNLVGINSNKEYLPHHTRQDKNEKGDSFLHKSAMLGLADEYMDKKCMAEKEHHYKLALLYRYMSGICRHIGEKQVNENYNEGSWYGNDTIWRTLLDLNVILQYADKKGRICSTRQRRFFNIGDMIVSGEDDGPVRPSRKDVGIIIAGEDPCSFDEIVTALMGFDGKQIPTIKHMRETEPRIYFEPEYKVISNNVSWDNKNFEYIYKNCNLGYIPNPGWKEVL